MKTRNWTVLFFAVIALTLSSACDSGSTHECEIPDTALRIAIEEAQTHLETFDGHLTDLLSEIEDHHPKFTNAYYERVVKYNLLTEKYNEMGWSLQKKKEEYNAQARTASACLTQSFS